MAGERGPDDPVGEFGLRLPQCNPRRGERGFACLDLAFGNRAGILDPTVATKQLLGFEHLHTRGIDREPLLPFVELEERLARADEVARGEHHPGYAARALGIDFRRSHRARRADCLDLGLVGKEPHGFGNHRDRLVGTTLLFGRATREQYCAQQAERSFDGSHDKLRKQARQLSKAHSFEEIQLTVFATRRVSRMTVERPRRISSAARDPAPFSDAIQRHLLGR